MSIHLLIADDHVVMRAGLRAILDEEADLFVVAEASSGEDALRLASTHQPDIVLLDIGLPGIDGIEATRRLLKQLPQIRILILSAYEDETMLREAIRVGASGYVIKRAAQEDLISAIRAVHRGEMYIHPAITRFLLKDLSPTVESKEDALSNITPRELEVMEYIIRGFTNRQIADELVISIRTVEGHRANLFGKLGIKNRLELVEFAEKNGLRS